MHPCARSENFPQWPAPGKDLENVSASPLFRHKAPTDTSAFCAASRSPFPRGRFARRDRLSRPAATLHRCASCRELLLGTPESGSHGDGAIRFSTVRGFHPVKTLDLASEVTHRRANDEPHFQIKPPTKPRSTSPMLTSRQEPSRIYSAFIPMPRSSRRSMSGSRASQWNNPGENIRNAGLETKILMLMHRSFVLFFAACERSQRGRC